MNNDSISVKTQDWMIQSVYTTRNSEWQPVNCLLRMTSPGCQYEKKLFLAFSKIQNIVPFVVDCNDPEESLKNCWLRVVENVVLIDDFWVVRNME